MPIRLAFFDVDGTLKAERDPYVYLHRQLGTLEQGLPYLQMFRRGEIGYDEWGQLDAQLWAGQEVEYVTHLLAAIPWMPGAHRVLAVLRQSGVQVALVSTGLDLHVKKVAAEIGAAFAFSNELGVADGHLTGELRVVIPEGGKGKIVETVMAEAGVSAAECVAVGDGRSDVDVFRRVGWSVAVAPEDDSVRRAASLTLDTSDLRPLAALLAQRL